MPRSGLRPPPSNSRATPLPPEAGQDSVRHALITRRERLWYPEPSRTALIHALEALGNDPPRHRTRSIAIIAEANGGKSALVERYLTLHPSSLGKTARMIPAVYVNMTLLPRVEDLSIALLKAIRASESEYDTHRERLKRFIDLAPKVGLRLIFLDEFHDCADTQGRGKPFLRCIKGLMNAGLKVVPMGTEELAEVLALDAQLSSRFNFSRGRLQRISEPDVAKAIVMEVAQLGETEVSDAAIIYLLSESKGVLGHMLDFAEDTLHEYQNLTLQSLKKHRKVMDALGPVV